ncbi:peptidoglycan DD-metalloendopeptidase family protein [Pseudoclavibacter sp. CFCC 14310]|uniref:M23 family metallopeptidase n=1 Tax=Pseudoclavibacter sp. CFCC 14310 TaxID=2615180 RepID=UPI001300FC9A|nr:M23 family metallopeptidase [Pseudoclavibacter sp. CFCC 14310]KAB1644418.1 peptidoglycan DD-metalloendopeptidase family protein [Pseudoclavibacter sp. CFCC 14310]
MMRALRRVVIGTALSVALVGGQSLVAPVAPSQAANYPSWDDINNAKNNEQAKQSEIARVQGLISDLNGQLDSAQAAVDSAQAAADAALQQVADQQSTYDTLRVQQLNAQARADESKRAAGASIAQLYRSGGTNASMNIYLSGDGADEVLYQLGVMGRFGESSDETYRSAIADAKTAESLKNQSDAALTQLQDLADDAAAKSQQAQQAQQQVDSTLKEQQTHAGELTAQLSALQGETAELQQQRAAGVQAEAEARAKAIAAAQAAAAAAASGGNDSDGSYAPAPAGGSRPSGGGGGGSPAPSPSSAIGFPLPYLKGSSGYGMRMHPIYHEPRFHYGTDFAVPQGTPILAIADGTIVGAGFGSSMGNYVDVRSVVGGQTIIARYFHLSRIGVSNGQRVSKGQNLGASGNTGASTGAHLHFEIHIGSIGYGSPMWKTAGNTVNPVTWMASH